MDDLETLRERLAGLDFGFVSVAPGPLAGPFPKRVVADMRIELSHAGGLSVFSGINSGGGRYTLSSWWYIVGDKIATIISFHDVHWTEVALMATVRGVDGDDVNGTLARRMEEAERFLQAHLSEVAGPYEVALSDAGSCIMVQLTEVVGWAVCYPCDVYRQEGHVVGFSPVDDVVE